MPATIQVTFDCAEPDRLARFWCEVLGYRVPDPPPGYDSWDDFARKQGIPQERWDDFSAAEDPAGAGPRLFFQRVPEGKQVKNRVHVDVNVGERGMPQEERRAKVDAEADRLVGLGATKVGPQTLFGGYWVVMLDPEGNEFCLQ